MFYRNLFLLGCFDDVQTQYSFEQQFTTNNCSQCFCGNNGSISCEQLQCESGKLNISVTIQQHKLLVSLLKSLHLGLSPCDHVLTAGFQALKYESSTM